MNKKEIAKALKVLILLAAHGTTAEIKTAAEKKILTLIDLL